MKLAIPFKLFSKNNKVHKSLQGNDITKVGNTGSIWPFSEMVRDLQ